MASFVFRGRSLKSGRSLRRRHDSEEEQIRLDISKSPQDNLKEILSHIVQKEGVSKARRLGYLNCLVKLAKETDHCQLGFSKAEMFCCLRVALFHEASDVRAAGLRAVRYLLKDEASTIAFRQAKMHIFVARSLDIVLDNRVERVHALRLIRKILCTCPTDFPQMLVACLVALVQSGLEEKDPLLRACLGVLGELAILNPESCLNGSGILDSILANINNCSSQQPQLAESLLAVVLCMLNHPATRDPIRKELQLEQLMAPLTDCQPQEGFNDPSNAFSPEYQERELKMRASQMAITSVLHSWPGLIYLSCTKQCNLRILVKMLLLPYPDTRKVVLELVYDLFALPIPAWTANFEDAMLSSDSYSWKESWQLFEGFVAAEGEDILPHLYKNRPNLVENYLALLLLTMVNVGILDALVDVCTCEEAELSIFALILLGELLHMCSRLLPPDLSHRCQSLPSLLAVSTSSEVSSTRRSRASSAVSCLDRMHLMKKRAPVPASVYLDHLLQSNLPVSGSYNSTSINSEVWSHSNPDKAPFYHWAVSKTKLQSCIRKESDESTLLIIKDTQVLVKNSEDWDWELIGSLLKSPGDILKRLEETNCRCFIRNVIDYFKPSSPGFSSLESSDHRPQEIAIIACQFFDFLFEAEENRAIEMLQDFFNDLVACLSELTQETVSIGSVLSLSRISQSCQYYFLFIGHLSSHNKGKKWLKATRILEVLLEIVGLPNRDAYVNLIVSSFDYTKDDFSRTLLNKVLTSSSDSSRLYATRYLRVLLRAGVPDFRKWGMELLINQLYDKGRAVSLAALDVLDEACEVQENLESLISLRPSLLHLGDRGLLILLKFLSLPTGFKFLSDANFIFYELHKWDKVNGLKYVKIVESSLNDSITRHRKGPDGTYGRRSTSRNILGKAYLPTHMYGQLARHKDGLDLLLKENLLETHFQRIQGEPHNACHLSGLISEIQILELKASLWTIGNIGMSLLGFSAVRDTNVIPNIVKMAAESNILSIRGTCFYVLGLLSSTVEGANVLSVLGWEGIRHSHQQKWPVLMQALQQHHTFDMVSDAQEILAEEEMLKNLRLHSWSVGSTGSHLSEWLTKGLIREADYRRYRQDSECSSLPEEELSRDDYMGRSHSFNTTENHFPGYESSIPTSHTLPINMRSSPNYFQAPDDIYDDKSYGIFLAEGKSVSDEDGSVGDAAEFPLISKSPHDENVLRGSRDSGTENDNVKEAINSEVTTTVNIIESLKVPVSSTKSRSGSCTDSMTSGISSCDSNQARTNHPVTDLVPQTLLSPIPSSTSLNTLVSLRKGGTTTSSSSFTSHVNKNSPHSIPVLPSVHSSFGFTTARDARGYATLRTIQKRRRVQSLGAADRGASIRRSTLSAGFLDSKKGEDPDMFENSTTDDLVDRISLASRESSWKDLSDPSSKGFTPNNKQLVSDIYMGLCLPLDPALLFKPTTIQIFETGTKECNRDEDHADGFEFHTEDNCLACHTIDPKFTSLRITNISEEGNEELGAEGLMESFGTKSERKLRNGNRHLMRMEVLHFVTNLSSSVGVKQSEQGLLSLKQRCPQAFQDLCLYSEICLQMARYKFRLTVRRFLQELFLDISFDQLITQAEDILKTSKQAFLPDQEFNFSS